MGKFENKVALITGAARGQGRRHAELLAAEGCNICLVDACADFDPVPYALAGEADLEETRAAVEAAGVGALAIRADVRSAADMSGAVEKAIAQFGQVDFLLANAGVLSMASIATSTPEQWQICIDVNLTGAYNSIRAVLPHMIERRSGKIVATASIGSRIGGRHGLGYVASKWGLLGLIKTAAIEAGPFGITANAVCPTNTDTAMWKNDLINGLFRPDLESPTFADIEPIARQMHPMGIPHIEPEDVSRAILFLLSDDARYISGEALHVSAGMIANNSA